jgi:hypothetical protein
MSTRYSCDRRVAVGSSKVAKSVGMLAQIAQFCAFRPSLGVVFAQVCGDLGNTNMTIHVGGRVVGQADGERQVTALAHGDVVQNAGRDR